MATPTTLTPTRHSQDESVRRSRIYLLLILLLTFGVYAPSLANQFAYDDGEYVKVPTKRGEANKMVAEWQGLGYFNAFYGQGASNVGRGFRPITVASFALPFQMFGGQELTPSNDSMCPAWPYHLTGILLHLLSVLVVHAMLVRLLGRSVPAAIGTLFFGMHALRSDPVISIVGNAEVLSFLFGGIALLCYLEVLRRRQHWRWLFGMATMLAAFLAYGSKESALAFVFFIPLFAVALGWQQPDWRERVAPLRQVMPWVFCVVLPAVLFFWLWMRATAGRWDGFEIKYAQNPLASLSGDLRIVNAVFLLGYGLYKTILPLWLACDYGPETFVLARSWIDYRFLIAATVLAGWVAITLYHARRWPLLFLSTAVYFGFLFVTSNVPFPIETIFAERLFYTPATALSFFVAWLAQQANTGWLQRLRPVLWGLAAVWVLLCGLRIFERCRVWYDNTTLFPVAADDQPRSIAMQMAAGRQFRLRGLAKNYEGTEGQEMRRVWKGYLDRALAIDPSAPLPLNDTASWHLQYAQYLEHSSRVAKEQGDAARAQELAVMARRHFEQTQEYLSRGFASPRFEGKQDGATMHSMQGDLWARAGRFDDAERAYRASIEANPKRPDSYVRLFKFLGQRGRDHDAFTIAEEGLKNQPLAGELRMTLMERARTQGDWQRVETLLRQGIELQPFYPGFDLIKGLIAHRERRFEAALVLLDKGMRIYPPGSERAEWLIIQADCLWNIGRRREAEGLVRQMLGDPRLHPRHREMIRKMIGQ